STASDPVGPVRSARSTDINIVSAFHKPLFAYSGANQVFKDYVARAPLVDVGVENYPDRYHRDAARPSPNNLFSATAILEVLAPADSRAPPALFAFRSPGEAAAAPDARPAGQVAAYWQANKRTDAVWDWDAALGRWRRRPGGPPHTG